MYLQIYCLTNFINLFFKSTFIILPNESLFSKAQIKKVFFVAPCSCLHIFVYLFHSIKTIGILFDNQYKFIFIISQIIEIIVLKLYICYDFYSPTKPSI
jgi:hypothetical protein